MENEAHCDFVKLREMLIRVNMEDLREQTHTRHYELYRRCKLEEMGFKDTDPDSKPFRWDPWSRQESLREEAPLDALSVCVYVCVLERAYKEPLWQENLLGQINLDFSKGVGWMREGESTESMCRTDCEMADVKMSVLQRYRGVNECLLPAGLSESPNIQHIGKVQ